MTADQVDVVFADAAADPELDRIETEAITAVFGPRSVPVTAPKTMTGRLYSGAAPWTWPPPSSPSATASSPRPST